MNNVKYRYFISGENITLNCNFEVSYWSGPAVKILEPETSITDIEILDKFGILKKWNVLPYTKGHIVRTALPQNLYKRLDLLGDKFDLRITNMSTSDEGLYICDPNNTDVLQKRFLLQNKCKYNLNYKNDVFK